MSDQASKDRIEKLDRMLSAKYLKKGIFYFVFITVATLLGIFLLNNSGNFLSIWSKIDYRYIFIGFGFMAVDIFLGGFRNHIFAKTFAKGMSLMVAVKANLANIFLGAVTPSQTGGGVSHWYIFWKSGLKTKDFITLSFANFISTLVFFPIAGFIAMKILKAKIPEGFIIYLMNFGYFVFTVLGVLVLVALFFPQVIGKILSIISLGLMKMWPSMKSRLSGFGERATKSMINYRKSLKKFLVQRPWIFLLSFILTALLYFNKFVCAYFLLLAFGVEADFWTVVAIQAVVYLILYFAPTPGGSGIAELSISGLMAGIISSDYSASFTLLYRSFMFFMPALLGAFVMLSELPKEKRPSEEVYLN